MKKILITSVIALLLAPGFTSCKKDRNCSCKKTSNAGNDVFVIHTTKRKAAEACEAIKTANPSYYAECVVL
jgi:hypothetical protein